MSFPSTGLGDAERLVVSPRRARHMLDCGNTRLYELLAAGELDSFLDGRSRKITVEFDPSVHLPPDHAWRESSKHNRPALPRQPAAHERRHGRKRATQTLRIGGAASPPWAAEEGAHSPRCDCVSASEHYVRTAAIRDAVSGCETDVLKALGILCNGRSSHIACPYPNHPDYEPSWRWDHKRMVAFCSCIGTRSGEKNGHNIFDVIAAEEGLSFAATKVRVVEIIGRLDLIIDSKGRKYHRTDLGSLLIPPPENRNDALVWTYLGNVQFGYGAGIRRFEDHGVAEVFLTAAKTSMAVEASARNAAIVASLALQHRVPLERLRHALTRNSEGSPSSSARAAC